MKQRKLIARSSNIATRERVYKVGQALEIDEIDHFEVRRSRVLFEDVVLITLHQQRQVVALAIIALLLALALPLFYFVWTQEPFVGWIVFAMSVAPLTLLFLVKMFRRTVVNVYSRRTQATMRFFSENKARRVTDELVAEIRNRQQQSASEPVAQAAVPPPPV